MDKMIRKRDGRVKPFNGNRIWNAIQAAYKEAYGKTLSVYDVEIREVYDDIYTRIDLLKDDIVSVETVQDIVIEQLNKWDENVAYLYKNYREERSRYRDSTNGMIQGITSIVNLTNTEVLTENSNKQSQLISTQRDLIAGEVSKHIARTSMIPKYLMDANDKGMIKIHDLDYYLQPSYNCELLNIDDMLQNGTVINRKKIDKPKSLRTAMTLVTQIAAQVSSTTYGGQTITLSHIAPFVRVSKEKIEKKYRAMALPVTDDRLNELILQELKDEIKDSVQTFNYQVSTLMTTNGQSPFISVAMYISENPEYEKETALLIEEFLKQRIAGMKNEYDVVATQTFPKLLYFLDENNAYEGSEYYWLTKLAVESTALRMNPDFISVKKMKEVIGYPVPPMGCRAMLSPFFDKDGNPIFYGRGNLGVQSICLPYAALYSKGDMEVFWNTLDEQLILCRDMCQLRYDKLKGVKANVAPILWQHGAIARLNHDDDILKAVEERGFTVTIGYSGLYETVKYLTGESHTTPKGFELAERIMKYLLAKCEQFKKERPHLRIALYGTPAESTAGWFNNKLLKQFGEIKDITDKGFITNSYHVDVREEIDAFSKIEIESELQKYSTGGAVSYIETHNMQHNTAALMQVVQFIYEKIMYAEINFECDICGQCKYSGVMDNDPETLKWICPQCGNDDQNTLSVVRRTCGYLGETVWTEGRMLDIVNRVKHI